VPTDPALGAFVAVAKLNDDIISGQTALGATPADTDEFLVSDAGTIKRVDYSYIKGLSNWSESSGNLLPSNASYGIYLGVNSATAANLLDDYEEGTWTPIFEGGSSNPTITYDGFTHGVYNKVGNVVFARGFIRTDSVSGGSGGLLLAGFPFNFPSQAYVSFEKGQEVDTWNNMASASNYRFVFTDTGQMNFKKIDTNGTTSFGTNATDTDFNSTSDLRITFTYTTT
jgi:hypothetical protein